MEEKISNLTNDSTQNDATAGQSNNDIKDRAQGLFISIREFLRNLLDFREDTDIEATIQAIKGDIAFKGATSWILICSVFVASIGLNANSTAVVIGAMLISPLLGPILGVGLSIAINDIDTLKRSLINLGIMIGLSLVTAFMFFYLFPLSEDTSELLGRVKPDIRDVLIAFVGGSALIIAKTKKGTIASVIYGVAIATALMPPLCTAGYGLAKGNWVYFGGAMYLFTINAIFIGLATFLILKVLRFPMLRYANSAKRKRIAQLASLLAIVVMVPAIWTFVNVLQETNFMKDAKAFVNNELAALPHSEYIKKNAVYNYTDSESTIELNPFGLDDIPDTAIALLRERMMDYPALKNTQLIFNQSRSRNFDNFRYMQELRSRDSMDILSQTQKITFLETKLKQLSKYETNQIPFDNIAKEIKINYPSVDQFSYAIEIKTNFTKMDTMPVFEVKWNKSLANENTILNENKKLESWLKQRLSLDTLLVKRVN